ncbi:MAG TPA: hypothetical protein VGN69_01555, partial [Solirubrobacteraceae bacterium]|nr:hypothetical protein [Solirubrobacteraceae bacterium]
GQTSGAVYLARDAPRADVGAWLTISRRQVRLAPGKSKTVTFTVRLPANAVAGDHLGGIVAEDLDLRTSAPLKRQKGSIRFSIRDLTVVAVQVAVPGPRTAGVAVSHITATGASGYQSLVLALTNTGNTMLKPEGRVVVTDAAGQRVADSAFQMDTFLPRSAIDYPVPVRQHALVSGNYRVSVTLRYSGQRSAVDLPLSISARQAQQVFKAPGTLAPPSTPSSGPPAGLIAGAGALAGVLLALGIMRWRRRRGHGTVVVSTRVQAPTPPPGAAAIPPIPGVTPTPDRDPGSA